jgi:hypothetical protein
MCKKAIIFLLLLTIVTSIHSFAENNAKTIKWLDGNWSGMKYQSNMDKAWKINLSCNSKEGTYTVEYPELNCKGYLKLESVTGKKVIFTEKMNSGSCIDGGYIIITFVSNNLISFTCLRDNKARLASYCTLEKINDSGSK